MSKGGTARAAKIAPQVVPLSKMERFKLSHVYVLVWDAATVHLSTAMPVRVRMLQTRWDVAATMLMHFVLTEMSFVVLGLSQIVV